MRRHFIRAEATGRGFISHYLFAMQTLRLDGMTIKNV